MTGDPSQVCFDRPMGETQEVTSPRLRTDNQGKRPRHNRGGGEGKHSGLRTLGAWTSARFVPVNGKLLFATVACWGSDRIPIKHHFNRRCKNQDVLDPVPKYASIETRKHVATPVDYQEA